MREIHLDDDLKQMTYNYPAFAHNGDLDCVKASVSDALNEIGSLGKVLDCKWSTKDNDPVVVVFTIEENLVSAFEDVMQSYL